MKKYKAPVRVVKIYGSIWNCITRNEIKEHVVLIPDKLFDIFGEWEFTVGDTLPENVEMEIIKRTAHITVKD